VAFHSRGINSAVGAYAAEIAKITPLRKLIVTGFSYGGLVAYALTVRLRRFPGVTANAVLLEPAIRRGSAWETPVIFKRFFHFTSRVFQEGPQEIWRALIKRIGNTEPSLGRPLPEPEPEPEPTEGERAWLLVGPHMRRNVRRYSPPTTPSQGIHLVFGTAWQRSHHSAFTSLCTPEPDTHPVGEIAHHDLVDDPRCIAVWRDLISRLLS
jgi:pimeloyl-ACP methyl ester carboxylesterase